jgi:hypothetical protein
VRVERFEAVRKLRGSHRCRRGAGKRLRPGTRFDISQLGLTANNVHRYSEFGRYPDDEFKHRLRFLLFASVWTVSLTSVSSRSSLRLSKVFLGIGHALVNLAVGGFLTFLTFVFWLVGAILWERKIDNLDCDGTSFTSICRQIQAIRGPSPLVAACFEAHLRRHAGIAWTLFGLSVRPLSSARPPAAY